MKIAVIDTTDGGIDSAGSDNFLPELFKGLHAKGNELHLIVKNAPPEKFRRVIEESNAILHTDLWQADGFVEETAPVLAKWLNDLDPDVYLIAASDDIGWIVLPLLRPRIATLTIGRRDSESFYDAARHYRSFLTRVVGTTPEVCVSYVLSCVIEKEKVEWIPEGVSASDAEPVGDGENVLRVICVLPSGEERRELADLLKIGETLSEKGVDFKLSIGGGGAESLSTGENPAKESGGKIVLRDALDGDELIEALRENEIFIALSDHEGFSRALIEALANGCCPVVDASGGGVNQLIEDGVNGFSVGTGDPPAFAEKLEFLSENRAELLKMRQFAWQTGKDYDIAKMIENYENCFKSAIIEAENAPRETYADYPLMAACRSRLPLWMRKLRAKTNL